MTARDDLIVRHLPLVRMIVVRRWKRRVPCRSDLDDLIQVGVLGLMEAARRFDPKRGVAFKAFAEHRVVGAVRDYLRSIHKRGRFGVRMVPVSWQDSRMVETLLVDSRECQLEERIAKVRVRTASRLRATLPRRTVGMLIAHCFDGAYLHVVGARYGLTESRVAQIVGRLRDRTVDAIESEIAKEVA